MWSRKGAGAPSRFHSRHWLRPYRRSLLVATLLDVAEVLVDLVRPWPLKVAVDNAIAGKPLSGWLHPFASVPPATLAGLAAAAAVVLVALSGLIGYLAGYLADAVAERIGADLRHNVMGRL